MTPPIRLRPATRADIPTLKAWDEQPHVQFTDPGAGTGSGWDWDAEIEARYVGVWHFIAVADSEPIGFVQIIDPHVEPFQYWGSMAAGHRAIDIWIGPSRHLNKGYGTQMMQRALDVCFADALVHTVLIDPDHTNTAAHRFYQRLGFKPVGRRKFGDDDSLVHALKRTDWCKRKNSHA